MSIQQIRFFKKNVIDRLNNNVAITVTDAIASDNGQNYVDYMRNRNNVSGWITTDSTDAANTTLVFDYVDVTEISDILIVNHNLKAYTLKYWDGSAWQNFSTPVAETTNTATTNHHSFNAVSTSKIQLIITGTQVVNDDKFIAQFIITQKIQTGQLEAWPVIKDPKWDTNKKINKMLSGKVAVVEGVGGFGAKLDVSNWNITADIDIIEEIYFRREGVLLWLCGGEDDQFSRAHKGYSKKDIFLVRPTNNYEPEFAKGLYKSGVKMTLQLQESID